MRPPFFKEVPTTQSAPLARFALALLLLSCGSGSNPASGTDAGDVDPARKRDASSVPAPEAEDAVPTVEAAPPDPARFQKLEEALLKEQVALGAPGVAVAVVEDRTVTYAKGFGVKHPDRPDPVRESTLFRIGSMTKVLTATALLQLADSAAVNLSSSIVSYVPNLRVGSNTSTLSGVTSAALLSQTAAISDYLEIDWAKHDDSAIAYLESRPFENFTYFMAPPGTFWNYSNPNFMAAGLIVERVSQTPYPTRMKTHVFSPLGMARTFFSAADVTHDGDFAYGKTVDWNTGQGPIYVGPESYDNPWARPAGYAWSSVTDLARFASFLLHGDASILRETTHASLSDKHVNTCMAGDHIHYGYGLFVHDGTYLGDRFYNIRTVEHGGDIPGYAANPYVFPEKKLALILLASADRAHFTKTVQVAVETLGQTSSTRGPNIAFSTADLDAYVGEYQDDHNIGHLTISKKGSTLEVSAPGLEEAGLAYKTQLECYVRDVCYLTMTYDSGPFAPGHRMLSTFAIAVS